MVIYPTKRDNHLLQCLSCTNKLYEVESTNKLGEIILNDCYCIHLIAVCFYIMHTYTKFVICLYIAQSFWQTAVAFYKLYFTQINAFWSDFQILKNPTRTFFTRCSCKNFVQSYYVSAMEIFNMTVC